MRWALMRHYFVPRKEWDRWFSRVTCTTILVEHWPEPLPSAPFCPSVRQLICVPLRHLELGFIFASAQAQRLSCPSDARKDRTPVAGANLAHVPWEAGVLLCQLCQSRVIFAFPFWEDSRFLFMVCVHYNQMPPSLCGVVHTLWK